MKLNSRRKNFSYSNSSTPKYSDYQNKDENDSLVSKSPYYQPKQRFSDLKITIDSSTLSQGPNSTKNSARNDLIEMHEYENKIQNRVKFMEHE